MNKALIKIAYRQVIDAASADTFGRNVFNDSYREFLMQVQAYNKDRQFTTWQEISAHAPKAAQHVPYKTGFAVALYIKRLHNRIPGLRDTLGCMEIPFASHRFEIVASSITDKAAHQVAITYFTDTFTLYGIIGEYLLLAAGDRSVDSGPADTFLLKMQPCLSVCSYLESVTFSTSAIAGIG